MPLPEEFSVEDWALAAAEPDRGGLTRAGRALHKHGSRLGSVYPEPRGNPAAMNRVAQAIVVGILNDPSATFVRDSHRLFGKFIDIVVQDGRGLRYHHDGRFMGFLEP